MVIPVLLFILGLILLIKGGDWFVDASVGIAHRFRLPELLIGATVVSIGTTLPEVMVSATGALGGQGAMAYGNAIGSVICNTALIAALTIAIKPSATDRKGLVMPVCFFFGSAVIYAFAAYFMGEFSRVLGIVLLAIFAVYIFFGVRRAMSESRSVAVTESADTGKPIKDIIMLIVGAAVIAVGANLLVDNGTKIAHALGVPESVIALTFVALGTSLPELVTAITSLVKGHGSLSLGNIIGANLFNLVLVSGISVTLAPFELPCEKTVAGLNASLAVDLPVMFAVMLILTVPALSRGRLSRFQGVLLLAIYAAYCAFQFLI